MFQLRPIHTLQQSQVAWVQARIASYQKLARQNLCFTAVISEELWLIGVLICSTFLPSTREAISFDLDEDLVWFEQTCLVDNTDEGAGVWHENSSLLLDRLELGQL